MRLVRPTNVRSMEELLRAASNHLPTYSETDIEHLQTQPRGYRQHHYEIELRSGEAVYERAVVGLRTWKAHRILGVAVFPPTRVVEVGATVLLALGPPYLAIAAPCRIVRVIETSTQYGFAYGTLPGHPEGGEEAFVVSRTLDGTNRFEITGVSRPESLLVRLSGPIAQMIQSRATKAYLRALKGYAES